LAKVLVVEDEKSLSDAYEMILKSEKHDVELALNGHEALDAFKKSKPDLALLDLRMPKMDGIEFLKKLQPSKKYPKTKIIVFSNYDDQQEIKEAFELGAHRYILKAWSSPNELLKVVRETLAEKPKG